MRASHPSLFDQQVYQPGQKVTITIEGEIASIRPAGHDHVILAIRSATGRPDHDYAVTYLMAGDPAVTITPKAQILGHRFTTTEKEQA